MSYLWTRRSHIHLSNRFGKNYVLAHTFWYYLQNWQKTLQQRQSKLIYSFTGPSKYFYWQKTRVHKFFRHFAMSLWTYFTSFSSVSIWLWTGNVWWDNIIFDIAKKPGKILDLHFVSILFIGTKLIWHLYGKLMRLIVVWKYHSYNLVKKWNVSVASIFPAKEFQTNHWNITNANYFTTNLPQMTELWKYILMQ